MRNGRAPDRHGPGRGCIRAGPKSGSRPALADLRLEPLVLAAPDVGQLDPVGAGRRLRVEVDRQVEAGSAIRCAEGPRELDAVVHRGLAERHERDHVHRADPRVLAARARSMSISSMATATSRSSASPTAAGLAGEREDGAVVAGVAGPVEQVDARARLETAAASRSTTSSRRPSDTFGTDSTSTPTHASRPTARTCGRYGMDRPSSAGTAVAAASPTETAAMAQSPSESPPSRRLPEAVDGRDHQPVRDAGQPAGDPAGGDRRSWGPPPSRSRCWARSSSCRSSCSACRPAPGWTGSAAGRSSSPATWVAPSCLAFDPGRLCARCR